MRRASGLAVCVALLALGSPAQAHGPSGASKGYVATFSSIEPGVLGLQVRVIAGTNRLLVQNWSGKRVVIFGSEGEPYLRFDARGVYWNSRSAPPASGATPVRSNPQAPPVWEHLNAGTSFTFADRRVGWAGTSPPDVVRRDPTHSHLIRYWRIPGTVDGRPFAIKGFLGYVPPPRAGSSGGLGWVVLATIAFAAIAAVVASLLLLRRRRARRPGGQRAPAPDSG